MEPPPTVGRMIIDKCKMKTGNEGYDEEWRDGDESQQGNPVIYLFLPTSSVLMDSCKKVISASKYLSFR